MKKLLLILTFLITSLFSFQVDIWQEEDNAVLNFNTFYDNVAGDEGNNWVAIYKSGDSNDWDNVITWAWAKDLAHNDNNYDERVLPLVTDEGSYEVRFFLNNSYDVFATYSYSNGGNGNNASLGVADINSNSVIFNNTTADQAWIGIYKKGDSNDWDNVKAWDWAISASTEIDISNLDGGGTYYEARLFYNNSYSVETTVEFKKDAGGNNDKGYVRIATQTSSEITLDSTGADEAWIGIYNKGDSNDWENVKAWDWVNNPTTIDISNLSQGTYEARLFYNNSYDVEASLEFTKNGDGNDLRTLLANDMKNRHDLFSDSKKAEILYQENENIIARVSRYDVRGNGHYRNSYSNSLISHYTYDGETLVFKSDLLSYNHDGRDEYKKVKLITDKYNNILIDGQTGFHLLNQNDNSYSLTYLGLSDENAKSNLYFKPNKIGESNYAHVTFIDENGISNESDILLKHRFIVVQRYTAGMASSGEKDVNLQLMDNTLRYEIVGTAVSPSTLIEFDISNPYDVQMTKEEY